MSRLTPTSFGSERSQKGGVLGEQVNVLQSNGLAPWDLIVTLRPEEP